MVSFLLAVVTYFPHSPDPAALQDAPPLLREIIPSPTGANGLEEYLHAADIVRSPSVASAFQDFVKTPRGNAKYLDACRTVIANCGTTFSLITAGNAKAVKDPRLAQKGDIKFKELPYFRRISQILSIKAHVEFADGNPRAATKTLVSALDFCSAVQGIGFYSHYLSGLAMQQVVLAEFKEDLARIPLTDWPHVEKLCDEAVANNPLKPVIDGSLTSFSNRLKTMLDGPAASDDELSSYSEEAQQIYRRTRSLTPAEKADLEEKVMREASSAAKSLLVVLESRESLWDAILAKMTQEEAAKKDPAVSFWLDLYWASSPSKILTVEVRRRTQLRLLKAMGRIEASRWKNGRLPAALAALDDQTVFYDPICNKPFLYKPGIATFELYSPGTQATGRIDLVYVRGGSSDVSDESQPIKP